MNALLITVALLAGQIDDSGRPTAAQVREAVQASRDQWKKEHPPRTAEQVKEIKVKSAKFRYSRAVQAYRGVARATTAEAKRDRIRARRELRDAENNLKRAQRTDFEPEDYPDTIPLTRMSRQPGIGVVGSVAEDDHRIWVEVFQVVDRGMFLGRIVYQPPPGKTVNFQGAIVPTDPDEVRSDLLLFRGIPTTDIVDGKRLKDFNHNLIVTGRYQYVTTLKATKVVYVVEPFDPDKEFE